MTMTMIAVVNGEVGIDIVDDDDNYFEKKTIIPLQQL